VKVRLFFFVLGLAAGTLWGQNSWLPASFHAAVETSTEGTVRAALDKGHSVELSLPLQYRWVAGQVYVTTRNGPTQFSDSTLAPWLTNANLLAAEERGGTVWLYGRTKDGLQRSAVALAQLETIMGSTVSVTFKKGTAVVGLAPTAVAEPLAGLVIQADQGAAGGASFYSEVKGPALRLSNLAWVDCPDGLNLARVEGRVWVLKAKGEPALLTDKSSVEVISGFQWQPGAFEFEVLAQRYLGLEKEPLSTTRAVLLAWALKDEMKAAQALGLTAEQIALVADLRNNTAKAGLTPDTFLVPYRWSLEAALGISTGSLGSRWDFPGSWVHESGLNPSTVQLFYQVLSRGKWAWGSNSVRDELSVADRNLVASSSLHYLFGPEVALRSSYPVSNPTLVRQRLTAVLNNIDLEKTGWTSSVQSWSPQGVSRVDLKYLRGSPPNSGVLLLPPSANLVTVANVANASELSSVMDPRNDGDHAEARGGWEVQFRSPQSVKSFVVWGSRALDATRVKVELQTSTQSLRQWAGTTFALRSVKVQEHWAVQKGAPATDRFVPYLVTLDQAAKDITRVKLSLPAAGVIRLFAYSAGFGEFTGDASSLERYTWTSLDDTISVTTSQSQAASEAEWLAGDGAQPGPVLLTMQGQDLTGIHLGPDELADWELFSPVRYLKGGWETPKSYSEKVMANWDWLIRPNDKPRNLRFPFTEMDADAANKSVDDSADYLSADLPRFATADQTRPYPYVYGVTLNGRDGTSFSKTSPFYVEKMAGVDGPGLLWSILREKLGDKLIYWPSSSTSRWDQRTQLPLPNVRDLLAAVKSGDPKAVQSLATPEVEWFLANSRVITDLGELTRGDILVGSEGTERSVAVVVSVGSGDPLPPNPLPDQWEKFRKRVLVVTIHRGIQAAVYTDWASMSLHPEGYHARRLLAGTAQSLSLPASDRFVAVPSSHTLEFSRNDGWVNWIPNTGELHWLGRMNLLGRQRIKDGTPWTLPKLGGAKDWGYSDGDAALGNVYRNSQNNRVRVTLYALAGPKKETGVSFQPDNTAVAVYELTATLGQEDFDVRLLVDPQRLVVSEGGLAWITDRKETWDQWGMVVTGATGAPTPGDDLALAPLVGEETVKSGRLAVYDKKLLWRANLYIDEGSKRDWNNLHPWVDGNDWNWSPKKITNGVETNSPDPTRFWVSGDSHWIQGDGTQVVKIAPYHSQRGVPAASSVAYEYGSDPGSPGSVTGGAADTPFRFNFKMLEQKENIKSTYVGGNANDVVDLDNGKKISRGVLQSWSSTKAPPADAGATNWRNYTRTPVAGHQAFVPGVSLFFYQWANTNNVWNLGSKSETIAKFPNARAAGLDCVGFSQGSASYSGNPYLWPNLAEDAWKSANLAQDIAQDNRVLLSDSANTSQYFAQISTSSNFAVSQSFVDSLKKVVPGDIFFYGHHIGVVQSVNMEQLNSFQLATATQQSVEDLLSSITTIESFFWGNVNYVDHRTIKTINTNGSDWRIVRLK